MGQVSGMQLRIHDHNKSKGTVSMSTDWVGVLSILGFPVLDPGSFDLRVETTAKWAGMYM